MSALRPALVDTHLHFWDIETQDHGWITGEWVPAQESYLGDYSSLKKTFVLEDLLPHFETHRVVKAVHVEADWEGDKVDETVWVSSLAADAGFPLAIVAGVDLRSPEVAHELARHAAAGTLRGVRMLAYYASYDLYEDPDFRRGLAALSSRELLFELGLTWSQLHDGVSLVAAFPDTQFVLAHGGMPLERGQEALGTWRRGIRQLANFPNVSVKLSGFGMGGHTLQPGDISPVFTEALENFGSERAMLASNWPVDSLFGTYDELIATYEALTADLSPDEQEALWHANAERLYRF